MAKRKHERQERKLNLDTFRRGIRGKVLEAVSITNELESRYISLEFQDQTELTITLDVRLTGKFRALRLQNRGSETCKEKWLVPTTLRCGGRRDNQMETEKNDEAVDQV